MPIAERARQEADDTAHLEADNQAAALQTQLELKAQQMRGKDALGAPDAIFPEWEQGVSKIAASLERSSAFGVPSQRAGTLADVEHERPAAHVDAG